MLIPFNKPYITGRESRYFEGAVQNLQLSGDGPFTKKCCHLIETLLGCRKALLTTSCTHALEMAALLLQIKPGDEIIAPSFTFVSTVNAFVLRGAKPVFADIRPDTLNLDERQLPELITPRTKAVIAMHYGGVGCEMDSILHIAARQQLPVIEDNAHGFGARYKGRSLGTLGCLATQSFHETKNLSCGEGGALIVNSPEFFQLAEIIRDKGTNRSRFFRGEVDKYTWVSLGSSYVLADILAAFLLAQLEDIESIQKRRHEIWDYYFNHLLVLKQRHGVQLPHVPEYCQQSYHMFYLLTRDLPERTALIDHLKKKGILAVFHYVPLHLSEMGVTLGGRSGTCPITENVSERLLRLPLFNTLTSDEQNRVIAEVLDFYGE
jgi:dTDP-4-amino-4,6-dideoxygalactose transaminase